jgi:GWxTD domain-containing protein
MSRDRLVPNVAMILALVCSLFLTVSAQKQQTPAPDQKPRKVRTESDRAFKEWPNEVGAIITEEERAAYEKLKTNEERENFIGIFWDNRDLDPDTQENEYKEEYYERLAYVNEHFASGKPGYLTDRGRIYLKWGKPDEIESHPMGGNYNRTANEGGGSTTTYPFERWFYRSLSIHTRSGPKVRPGVDLEFVDPTGSGEYRLARNPNEKDALLFIPGAGLTLGEQLGFETKSERIAGYGSYGLANYRSAKDSPFEVMDLDGDMNSPPAVGRRYGEIADNSSPKIEAGDAINLEVAVHSFRQTDSRGIALFAIQTNNKDLVFHESGGLQTAKLNIFARIVTVTNRRVGTFEDSVTTIATPAELSQAKGRDSIYGRAVSLLPGIYRVDVTVRDVESGAVGYLRRGFTIPKYEPDKLAASSIILAAKLEGAGNESGVRQFVIGETKVIPNVARTYHRGQPVGLYLQVYNAGIDQTTLRPSVDVEYVLTKDGKELSRQTEDWRGSGDPTERLILSRLIDTQSLVKGAYEIEVRIKDRVTGQMLSPSVGFKVE